MKKRSIHSQAYGQGTLYDYPDYEAIIVSKNFDQYSVFQKAKEEAELRQQIRSKNLCNLIKFQTSEQKALCGVFFRINLVVEYFPKTLKDVAHTLGEDQFFKVIKDVIHGLAVLQSKKIRHGFINPQSIIATNENFKITDIRFLTDLYEYRQHTIGYQTDCYLAPKLLEELGNRTFNPIYNYEKSEVILFLRLEVFSLGVTILETCLGRSVQNIYDLDRHRISQSVIDIYLKQVQDKYSHRLADLLARMLDLDDQRRISVLEIRDMLRDQSEQSSFISNVSTTKKPIFDNRPLTPTPQRETRIISQTFASPIRIQDSLSDRFNEFDNDLQSLKQKFSKMKINTPTSQGQTQNSYFSKTVTEPRNILDRDYNYSSVSSFVQNPETQFNYYQRLPSFNPVSTKFPHNLDLKLNQEESAQSFQTLNKKIDSIKIIDQFYHQQDYQDNIFASLPQSSVIHMHNRGPTYLKNEILKFLKLDSKIPIATWTKMSQLGLKISQLGRKMPKFIQKLTKLGSKMPKFIQKLTQLGSKKQFRSECRDYNLSLIGISNSNLNLVRIFFQNSNLGQVRIFLEKFCIKQLRIQKLQLKLSRMLKFEPNSDQNTKILTQDKFESQNLMKSRTIYLFRHDFLKNY
ncbi:hypothetical protein pb186bvf_005584, partial [Paramecium bursaria]